MTVGQAIICPADNCRINVALPNPALQLGFAAPSAITARARILVDGRIPIRACAGSCNSSCGGTFCATIANPVLVLNTRRGNHPHIGLSTNATRTWRGSAITGPTSSRRRARAT